MDRIFLNCHSALRVTRDIQCRLSAIKGIGTSLLAVLNRRIVVAWIDAIQVHCLVERALGLYILFLGTISCSQTSNTTMTVGGQCLQLVLAI